MEAETIPFDSRTFGKGLVNTEQTSTGASALIDAHYATLGIQGAWDEDRVLRLCGWLRITRYELASLVMYPHQQMKKSMKTGYFPGPVALLFTILENELMPDILMDAIPEDKDTPIIPSDLLNHGSPETS